jgi:hypothetical protein
VKILAYHLPGHANANDAVIWMATQSVGLYAVKFAPYPYPSLTIVESDLQDGQEFDGWCSRLEVLHGIQQFGAQQSLQHRHARSRTSGGSAWGSDQASEPWLDEALSVYSERIFYEYNHPGYGDWWWNFRVNFFGPSGYVDQGVYGFSTFRGYVNAVYLNGANMMDELRTRVGDEAFFDFLEDYPRLRADGRLETPDSPFCAGIRATTSRILAILQGQYWSTTRGYRDLNGDGASNASALAVDYRGHAAALYAWMSAERPIREPLILRRPSDFVPIASHRSPEGSALRQAFSSRKPQILGRLQRLSGS